MNRQIDFVLIRPTVKKHKGLFRSISSESKLKIIKSQTPFTPVCKNVCVNLKISVKKVPKIWSAQCIEVK